MPHQMVASGCRLTCATTELFVAREIHENRDIARTAARVERAPINTLVDAGGESWCRVLLSRAANLDIHPELFANFANGNPWATGRENAAARVLEAAKGAPPLILARGIRGVGVANRVAHRVPVGLRTQVDVIPHTSAL